MKNPENTPTERTKAILKSTKEWLARNNTRIVFPKDSSTIEDVPPEVLSQDLREFGY